MVLTSKSREELHAAILEYLLNNKFNLTADAFRQEACLDSEEPQSPGMKNILEMKWTSVVRLKKQIMEMEKITFL